MAAKQKRAAGMLFALALLASSAGFFVSAQAPQEVGTWAPSGTIADARSGAASVALGDGRTLILGGRSGDAVSDSVVVYDPATTSLVIAGQLLSPRAGHTATLLENGSVLVAGGLAGGAASADIEIFDPASGTSTPLGQLAQARTGHAAARVSGGIVVIFGGTNADGTVLDSVERVNASTGGVTAGSHPMLQARTGASATTLIHGLVLVAGGNSGSADLRSAELYDPAGQSFQETSTELSAARSGHTAVLLPHNAGVLIAGGTTNGTARTTTDLFVPVEFPDPFSFGMGTFAATGAMANARTGAAGGPGRDGYAWVDGGGSADPESYRFATIKTDKDDYAPGERAVITGSGWLPNAEVRLVFQEDPAVHGDYVLTVTADGAGNIRWDEWAPEEHDLGVRFYLLASDARSRAQTTFTDGQVPEDGVTIGAQTPASIAPGDVATYDVTVRIGGNSTPCTVTLDVIPSGTTPIPAGTTFEFRLLPPDGTLSNTITAGGVTTHTRRLTLDTPTGTAPNTTYTFTVRALQGSTCQNQNTRTAIGSLVVGAAPQAPTTTTLNSSPNPSTFNQTATFTATVVRTSDSSPVTVGTVSFIEGGTCAAPTVTHAAGVSLNPSGQAQFSTSTLDVSAIPHTIHACYSGATAFAPSSGSTSHTVNRRTTTTTVTLNPASVALTQASQATVLVTDTDSAGTKLNPGVGTTVLVTSNVGGDTITSPCTLAAVTGTDDQSSCQVSITASAIGNRTITAAFAQTSVHATSTGTATLTVNRRATTTAVTLLPATVAVAQASQITVLVTDAETAGTKSNPAVGTTVSVTSAGAGDIVTSPCTLAAVTGTTDQSSCQVSVTPAAAGGRTITATFAQTSVHATSTGTATLNVNRRATTTTVTLMPPAVVVSQASQITVTVEDVESAGTKSNPGVGTTVLVTSTDSGDTITTPCTLAAVSGSTTQSSCQVSVTAATAGNRTITAAFAQTNVHSASTGTALLTVNRRATTTTVTLTPATVVVSQASQITVTVEDVESAGTKSNPGVGTTVLVTSTVGGDTITTPCTLTAVSGSTEQSSCQVSVTAAVAGSRTISATFSATPVHQGSTGSATLTVNRRTTSTTVVLNPTTLFVNQTSQVTVTVTDVESAGTKSNPGVGTIVSVTSTVAGEPITSPCTLAAVSGTTDQSRCQVSVTPAVAGLRTITATFGATDVHQTSVGTAYLTANLRTTLTGVALALATISEGSSTTVTVLVSDVAGPGAATPAGSVTFVSSIAADTFTPVTCGLVPVSAEVATCAVTITAPDDRMPASPAGYGGFTVHYVTATYAPAGTSSLVHAPSSGTNSLTVNNVIPAVDPLAGLPSAPVALGSLAATVTLSQTNFSDPGTVDTHTCSVNWGDGTVETITGGVRFCASAPHTYTQSGVFAVTLTVTDDDGGVGTSRFEYVVVYPPDGHVTGGGWINSPAGAYAADPLLVGKANFGFVSKYKRGQSVPDGQTEFQFKAGNLDFHSISYEWLVVSGARAQFFGTGAIKGLTGEYWFKLTAIDGQLNGGGTSQDRFRIKIWVKLAGGGDGPIVYDNQMGQLDNGDASTALSGGSIVIHSPK